MKKLVVLFFAPWLTSLGCNRDSGKNPDKGGVAAAEKTLDAPLYQGKPVSFWIQQSKDKDAAFRLQGSKPLAQIRSDREEAIAARALAVVQAGKIVPDVFRLILAQIRSKHETAGDFRAQVAANHTGARRLVALLDRQGFDDVIAYIDELIRYTEEHCTSSAEIAKLPKGAFAG